MPVLKPGLDGTYACRSELQQQHIHHVLGCSSAETTTQACLTQICACDRMLMRVHSEWTFACRCAKCAPSFGCIRNLRCVRQRSCQHVSSSAESSDKPGPSWLVLHQAQPRVRSCQHCCSLRRCRLQQCSREADALLCLTQRGRICTGMQQPQHAQCLQPCLRPCPEGVKEGPISRWLMQHAQPARRVTAKTARASYSRPACIILGGRRRVCTSTLPAYAAPSRHSPACCSALP